MDSDTIENGETGGEPAARAAAVIGTAYRARRRELGLTLAAVAEKSGLSTGFVSQIESGAANPTVSALSQLARALDLPLSCLLAADSGRVERTAGDFPPRVRPAPLPAPPSASGRVWDLTAPGARQSRLTLVQGEPGDHAGPITHPGEEICVVTVGEYRLHIEGDSTTLVVGDSAHYPATVPHHLEPISANARALIIMTGAD